MRPRAGIGKTNGERRKNFLNLSPVFRLKIILAIFWLLLLAASIRAAEIRLVILKIDGLPQALVDEYVSKIDPQTGRSYLPWIQHLFYEEGIRLTHFYTRGLTLSAPAWVVLDTGHLPVIRGNVEFDRISGRVEDYLNYNLYYWERLRRGRLEPRLMEILNEAGISLFSDIFPPDKKYLSPQLVQRVGRWMDLARPLVKMVEPDLKKRVGDLVLGVDAKELFLESNLAELLANLADERRDYLDFYSPVLDKRLHNDNSEEVVLETLREIDRIIGRIHQVIQNSPRYRETVLVLVSDHGFNTNPRLYSQGFNIGNYLRRAELGGHHLLTKREILSAYSLRSLNPVLYSVINESDQSLYLRGKKDYYTAILDFDGNERASLHLRNSDLNLLHMVLLELKKKLAPAEREEKVKAARAAIERWRTVWEKEAAELGEELAAVRREIKRCRDHVKKSKLSPELKAELKMRAERLERDEKKYSKYRDMLERLLAIGESDPGRIKPEELVLPGVLGPRNNIYRLQNYIVGRAIDGKLINVDYFAALKGRKALNNIQPGVSPYPVDFIAARIPYEEVARTVAGSDLDTGQDLIWLYGGAESQALIVPRLDYGKLELKYVPVAGLHQHPDGTIAFQRIPFKPGLPLRIWEDEKLKVQEDREEWLDRFHDEEEWRAAMHETKYCLAVIGLYDLFASYYQERLKATPGPDGALLDRFWRRLRRNTEPDLHIFASDGWNFDVKDFNPGGNHGAFFRASAHSVFMLWGGAETGLKRGVKIEAPYDSLSFVPTLLVLLEGSDSSLQEAAESGFGGNGAGNGHVYSTLPGLPVREIFSQR